jgi:hypothetical protein
VPERAENDIRAALRRFGPVTIVGAREPEFACEELQIVHSKHTLPLEPERFSAPNATKCKVYIFSEWHNTCNSREEKTMPVRYHINDPTIAMFQQNGQYAACTVASGTVVDVVDGPIDGDKLVDVIWDGRDVMMFTQDLRSRADRIE